MTPTHFYSSYPADDGLSDLSYKLAEWIKYFNPAHVIDVASGTGKHMKMLHDKGVVTHCIDISPINVCTAMFKHDLPFVARGNDSHLRHYTNFDVCTTCSFLDHVEDALPIVNELKRICNTAIVLAEPLYHNPEMFYWAHDYESWGFQKIETDYVGQDGNPYYIFIWRKEQLQNEI